jgi:hypothetical protein
MTPYRIEQKSAGLAIPVAVCLTVSGLLAFWFYSLFQPQYIPNPGLAAYTAPPATVIAEMPARKLEQHRMASPPAEIASPAEEPIPTVVVSKPEPTIEVKQPKRPKAKQPRQRNNPYWDYAASYPRYRGYQRSFAFQGYGGFRPF